MAKINKIAILTSGGDAPGMNSVIRAVVRSCLSHGVEIYGIYNGYAGLINREIFKMERGSVTNISNRGGTILGTARLPEFSNPEVCEKGANILKELGIQALVVLGGDGTYHGAQLLASFGINTIGIPCTIDNDIASTDYTIGFDTAVNTAVEAIDKLRDTCNSHQRCSIIEVMGRYCGDIAYAAGVASGCDIIINSDTGYDEQKVIDYVLNAKRLHRRHLLIIITEHVTDVTTLARKIQDITDFTCRATILGHIQRGGKPSPFDRILATRLGDEAVCRLLDGESSVCLGVINNEVVSVSFEKAFGMKKNVFAKYAIKTNNNVR